MDSKRSSARDLLRLSWQQFKGCVLGVHEQVASLKRKTPEPSSAPSEMTCDSPSAKAMPGHGDFFRFADGGEHVSHSSPRCCLICLKTITQSCAFLVREGPQDRSSRQEVQSLSLRFLKRPLQ
jgi:hypothetical protein